MIIVRIQGGLGNQLFQYAMGYALSFKLGKKLYLDTSGMDKAIEGYFGRNFLLSNLNISTKDASPKLLKSFSKQRFVDMLFKSPKYHIKQLVFEEIPPKEPFYNKAELIVKNETYTFEPDIFEIYKGKIYLSGYWQSYKFFESINDKILNEFEILLTPTIEQKELIQIMKSSISVSLHIRRTDYLTTDFGKKHFISLPISYYQKALKVLETKFETLKLFIFSDDIEWCKTYFKTEHPSFYISNDNPLEDLYLMKNCKHNIIANSTFSWWAAWLNNNPEKIVLTPALWYKNVNADKMNDLIPENWIKIEL